MFRHDRSCFVPLRLPPSFRPERRQPRSGEIRPATEAGRTPEPVASTARRSGFSAPPRPEAGAPVEIACPERSRRDGEGGASRCVMKCHVPSWPIAIRGDGGAVRPRAAGPGRGKPHTEAAACSCNVHIADVKAFPAPAATHFEIAGHGAAPGAARVLLSRESETPLPQYPSRAAPDACPGPRSGERRALRKKTAGSARPSAVHQRDAQHRHGHAGERQRAEGLAERQPGE